MRRRVRVEALGIDGVPPALYDYRDPAWSSDEATQQWCEAHGLPSDAVPAVTAARSARAPQYRRQQALRAWGHTLALDDHRLVALGLTPAGSPTGPRFHGADEGEA